MPVRLGPIEGNHPTYARLLIEARSLF